MNLIMNSIDAMKDVDGTRELCIKSQRTETGQLLISVTDTGVGLPPQHADQIFDAFFTTKPDGTGMGLRISRSVVESHGGRLWAADNPPRGASFCFTLPPRLPDFTGRFAGKEFVGPASRRLSCGHRARPSGRPEAGATVSGSADPASSSGHASVGGHFRHSVGKYTPSIHNVSSPDRGDMANTGVSWGRALLAFGLQS